MAFVQDDLGGHVLRSPTERPRLLTQTHLLSKAKIHLGDETKMINILHTIIFIFNVTLRFLPAWRNPCGPGWCSRVWGLCIWFLWSAGRPEPRWRSWCRTGWCCHQTSPWKATEGRTGLVRQMVVMINNDWPSHTYPAVASTALLPGKPPSACRDILGLWRSDTVYGMTEGVWLNVKK